EVYDPLHNTWTSKAPMPTARFYLAAAPDANGLLYAFGGISNSGTLQTVEAYRPSSSASAITPIQVTDPAPVVSMLPVTVTEGTPFTGAVATFTDPGGAEAPGNYVATID